MEPANFPEIYTGNGDESDRMQDIAGAAVFFRPYACAAGL